jgi:hypothetical protein
VAANRPCAMSPHMVGSPLSLFLHRSLSASFRLLFEHPWTHTHDTPHSCSGHGCHSGLGQEGKDLLSPRTQRCTSIGLPGATPFLIRVMAGTTTQSVSYSLGSARDNNLLNLRSWRSLPSSFNSQAALAGNKPFHEPLSPWPQPNKRSCSFYPSKTLLV